MLLIIILILIQTYSSRYDGPFTGAQSAFLCANRLLTTGLIKKVFFSTDAEDIQGQYP